MLHDPPYPPIMVIFLEQTWEVLQPSSLRFALAQVGVGFVPQDGGILTEKMMKHFIF